MPTAFIGSPTNLGIVEPYTFYNFQDFCNDTLAKPIKGEKLTYFYVPGSKYSSNDAGQYPRQLGYQQEAWLVVIDGDTSFSNPSSCIPPYIIHEALKRLNINHAVHTTYSHTKNKNKWRAVIPCITTCKDQMVATMQQLYEKLVVNDCEDLVLSNESLDWVHLWFRPSRANPDDGEYLYYDYHEGLDLPAVNGLPTTTPTTTTPTLPEEQRTYQELIQIVAQGVAGTGLHRATRDLAYMLLKDSNCKNPTLVKETLRGFMCTYDLVNNPRQKENYSVVDRTVDTYVKKYSKENAPIPDEFLEEDEDSFIDVYTKYPDQGGKMEHLVQACMEWQPFPNREIAVVTAHALVSTLGGRVYTIQGKGGIVYTALLTGRTGIGKSFIAGFCDWAIDSIGQTLGLITESLSFYFMGSYSYTAPRFLVKELERSGSLLTVRTESGQIDRSKAGDMKRLLAYELEAATKSGAEGSIGSTGQKDRVNAVYSPAITTVRESVAEAQHLADIENDIETTGVKARRNHTIVRKLKSEENFNRRTFLPPEVSVNLMAITELAREEGRADIYRKLPEDRWKYEEFEDAEYIKEKSKKWRLKENQAVKDGDKLRISYYSRLYIRVPAWAGRLAALESPHKPVITNKQIDIAEASFEAEQKAIEGQLASGDFDPAINKCVTYVVKAMRNRLKNKTILYMHRGENEVSMLASGAVKQCSIYSNLRLTADYKAAEAVTKSVEAIIAQKLPASGINLLTKAEAFKKYNYNGSVLEIQK